MIKELAFNIGKNVAHSAIGEPLSWLENYFNPEIIIPPSSGVNNDYSAYVTGAYKFRLQVIAPSNEDIKALDDFFESFGYRIDRFKLPVLNVRSTFTYIKTRDASVSSSNINAAKQMQALLNAGCKFWIGEIG